MSSKRKILLAVGLTFITLTLVIVAIVAINFREYGINSAKEKAYITAEIVRDGLTAHMVNGIMDKRGYFLDQIARAQNVQALWVVRADSVTKQFGETIYNETARDDIDKKVLEKGQRIEKLEENPSSVHLRVTVPYIATAYGTPNCLQCHQAKDGEVLGAVSMVFDISDVRYSGLITVLRIVGIVLLFLIIAIWFANRYITPYLELFESLSTSISKAEDGDFSSRIQTKLTDEAGAVAHKLNSLYEKLEQTLRDIDKKSLVLLSSSFSATSKNPLIKAKEVISEMADIYRFKRTVELDATKDQIYGRIFDVLRDKFLIERFTLFETDNTKNEIVLVYDSEIGRLENKRVDDKPQDCRAFRTNAMVYSDEFKHVCPGCIVFEGEHKNYICIPFKLTNSRDIVVSIKPSSIEEGDRVKRHIPLILSYLEAARPVLESRFLTEILRDSSLRDALTGLYNRKFLEEYVQKASHQALRAKTTYAILMIDIDYFKMVNDTYGHDIGDLIIKGLADVLRESIREADLAIRFGGEEFLVLLYNPTVEGAIMVAEKIRQKFEAKSFYSGKEQIKKTCSVGISIFPNDAESFWKAIKFADVALYKAKEGGRNRVIKFERNMTTMGDMY